MRTVITRMSQLEDRQQYDVACVDLRHSAPHQLAAADGRGRAR